jgi:hypothetical protein
MQRTQYSLLNVKKQILCIICFSFSIMKKIIFVFHIYIR